MYDMCITVRHGKSTLTRGFARESCTHTYIHTFSPNAETDTEQQLHLHLHWGYRDHSKARVASGANFVWPSARIGVAQHSLGTMESSALGFQWQRSLRSDSPQLLACWDWDSNWGRWSLGRRYVICLQRQPLESV